MNKHPSRRSSLFLMEFIIAVLFFILASTVCVQFFVKSHMLEQESVDLNHAVTAASSVAEILRSQEDPFDTLTRLYPKGTAEKKRFSFYYDENWNLCSAEDVVYSVNLDTNSAEGFRIGIIQVFKSSDPIYQLTVKKYLRKEASL